MDGDRPIFHLELLLLYVSTLVKASTITVDKDHCGGETILNQGQSLFLNYYGAKLEDDSGFYSSFRKTCRFEVSTPRGNHEICIRKTDRKMSSVYELKKLKKCYSVFKYYKESYWINSLNSYSCYNFNTDPLCTSSNIVAAVFENDISGNYIGVSLEFEIYVRTVKRDTSTQQETWSSWTSGSNFSTTNDSESGISWGQIFLAGLCFSVFVYVLRVVCNKNKDNSRNIQETERPADLPDNPFRNERADGHLRTSVNNFPSESPDGDPWEPPNYQSLTAIDQSFYGEVKPCQKLPKETGSDSIDYPNESPPPYPGV